MATSRKEGCIVDVVFEDNIAIITFNCGQNKLNTTFLNDIHQALDKVESNANVHALITTGSGKFYSNGLDFDWLNQCTENKDLNFMREVLPKLYLRFLTFPVLTIAAINGHAYAGGALLAFCHDYRIMRTKRGWICMNEVHINLHFRNFDSNLHINLQFRDFHINLQFTDFLSMLLRTKLPSGQVFHECVVLGKSYTADDALKAGIVDIACNEKELMNNAIDLVKKIIPKGGYDRDSLKNMKMDMNKYLFIEKDKGKSKL